MDNIQQILQAQQRYTGDQYYIRLYMLAIRYNLSIKDIEPILKESKLYFAIYDLQTKLTKDCTVKEELSHIKLLCNQFKAELMTARNNQNRQAVKDLNKDLADTLYRSGDMIESQATYFKVHENNQRIYNLDFVIQWACSMLWNQNFTHFRIINVPISNDSPAADHRIYQQWLVINAVRNFMKQDFKGFLQELLKINIKYFVAEDVQVITSIFDLGRYFIISALITKNQKEIIQCIQNPMVQLIVDNDQFIMDVINSYIDYDFAQLIQQSKQLLNDLQYDYHVIGVIVAIQQRLFAYLIKQYIINFKTASLKTIGQLMKLNVNDVILFIEEVIISEGLNYLIDPVNMTVVQKHTLPQQELVMYSQITEQLLNQIDQNIKYLQALYKFSNVSISRAKLLQHVVREYKHEFHNYDQDVQMLELIKSTGYTYTDIPNSNKVVLERKFPNAKVIIEFKATTPEVEGEVPVPEQESESSEEDNDGSQQDHIDTKQKEERKGKLQLPSFSVDFTVIVESKNGESIAIECNTQNQVPHINYVQPIYDITEYRNRSKIQKFMYDYTGPAIHSLDDRLTSALYDYLASFEINKGLLTAVEALSLDKEQRMYMEFLKKMESFLS